ncbi:hypothetical protein BST36_00635 [Mycolicibacterium moriokaense]|uniref:DUF5642 domain-containing protein n=1 Tax=Mycolicibacterium moriokaense TaxID=39691 RepID=A0AAD1M5Q4_9MYCO|nr:DUF5642 family protein [Mycolicibacterium moriokaense]MCV7041173.1 DUF5642 family protein [Mycolicibacterium moriokaense]ORB27220.1 hypothetical protein BST36_00635 [Mycolicibacterium moriokaense]BBX00736.1 hypothetical protein MMOR_16720 [Mycolicibacterium moriokaense]
MSKSAKLVSQLALVCAGVLAACGTGESPNSSNADIARVKDVRSSFGPQFKVTEFGPAAIDPRLLGPQALPAGMKFDPADCGSFATAQVLPAGVKGNMAATTAEGDGNRYIAIAVETSEPVPVNRPAEDCQRVGFAGGGVRGLVEVVEAPTIDGAPTMGTHRVLQTVVNGKPSTGEIYNYIAGFDTFLVIVTANPLVLPDKPVTPVDTQRARDLLTAAVTAVRG